MPCPTSEATVGSWPGWTVVPSASVYSNSFVAELACFSCSFSLYYQVSSLTFGGLALCLNFGPGSELGVNEWVVPLLLFVSPFSFLSVFYFLLFTIGSCFISCES